MIVVHLTSDITWRDPLRGVGEVGEVKTGGTLHLSYSMCSLLSVLEL